MSKHPFIDLLMRILNMLNQSQRSGPFSSQLQEYLSIDLEMDQHLLGCVRTRGKERLTHSLLCRDLLRVLGSQDLWSLGRNIYINQVSFQLYLEGFCELAMLGLAQGHQHSLWGRIMKGIQNLFSMNQFPRLIMLLQLCHP